MNLYKITVNETVVRYVVAKSFATAETIWLSNKNSSAIDKIQVVQTNIKIEQC